MEGQFAEFADERETESEEETEERSASGGVLKPKQELAARLIADGYTQTDAARDSRINVTKVTMHRWTKDPVFQRLVESLRTNTVQVIEGILAGGAEAAAQTVVDIAAGRIKYTEIAELTPRIKAALYILDRLLKKTKLPPTKVPSRSQLPNEFEGDAEVNKAMQDAKS